jgi:hypothetical protein
MEEEFIEIYRARGEIEAQVIRSKLESYGIPSILKSHAAPSAFAFTIDGMGEFKVMVKPEMEDEARRLIEEADTEDSNDTVAP